MKKFLLGVVVVFVLLFLTNLLIHGVILASAYESPDVVGVWRADMMEKAWVMDVVWAIIAVFLTLIYAKGHEGKGIMEGVRFGLYTGFLLATPMAYASFATFPIPYHITVRWFIYGIAQYLIIGIALNLVYGKTPTQKAPTV